MIEQECKLVQLQAFRDSRGSLSPINFKNQFGFVPQRSFLLSVPAPNTIRGEHAHFKCVQAIQCLHGELEVAIVRFDFSMKHILSNSDSILIIPPLTWVSLKFKSADSIANVYASHPFDESDYIRNYEDFQIISKEIASRGEA
jgi:hypothetical protein